MLYENEQFDMMSFYFTMFHTVSSESMFLFFFAFEDHGHLVNTNDIFHKPFNTSKTTKSVNIRQNNSTSHSFHSASQKKINEKKDSNCRQRQVIYENVLYKIHDSPHVYSKLHTYCNFVLVWKAIITLHSPYELKRMLNCSLHKKLQQEQFCKLNCNRCVVNNLLFIFFTIFTWETVACFSLNQVIKSVREKWKEKLRIHIVPKLWNIHKLKIEYIWCICNI